MRSEDVRLIADADIFHAEARSVVVGCDIAKHADWTVLIAVDAKTGICLEMERFNQCSTSRSRKSASRGL